MDVSKPEPSPLEQEKNKIDSLTQLQKSALMSSKRKRLVESADTTKLTQQQSCQAEAVGDPCPEILVIEMNVSRCILVVDTSIFINFDDK